MKLKKILFPTDLSEGAGVAKDVAVALAKKHGAELLFLHVVFSHREELHRSGDLLSDWIRRLEKDAESRLEKETSELRRRGWVVHYAVIPEGSAFDAIQERVTEWSPDLIVMATHGRRGMGRWFLGSVTERVVRHVPCAVLTVRPPEKAGPALKGPSSFERVLVAVDFSDNSRRALEAARRLIGEGGTLLLQHVVMNPTLAGIAPGERLRLFSEDPTLPDKIRAEMDAWIEKGDYEAVIVEGDDVAASILDTAREKEADLIALGTRGRTGVELFLTGSVAEKVIRASTIPVLTVK